MLGACSRHMLSGPQLSFTSSPLAWTLPERERESRGEQRLPKPPQKVPAGGQEPRAEEAPGTCQGRLLAAGTGAMLAGIRSSLTRRSAGEGQLRRWVPQSCSV